MKIDYSNYEIVNMVLNDTRSISQISEDMGHHQTTVRQKVHSTIRRNCPDIYEAGKRPNPMSSYGCRYDPLLSYFRDNKIKIMNGMEKELALNHRNLADLERKIDNLESLIKELFKKIS